MRFRKLSTDKDYTFGSGQLDFYRDVPEAVAQAAECRLLLWTGEWFLDTAEGTPYMVGVLGKHSQASADVTIQDRVAGTQGLTNIQSYESEVNTTTRAITAEMTINTIYGPTEVEIANYRNF